MYTFQEILDYVSQNPQFFRVEKKITHEYLVGIIDCLYDGEVGLSIYFYRKGKNEYVKVIHNKNTPEESLFRCSTISAYAEKTTTWDQAFQHMKNYPGWYDSFDSEGADNEPYKPRRELESV